MCSLKVDLSIYYQGIITSKLRGLFECVHFFIEREKKMQKKKKRERERERERDQNPKNSL
jgi:hypothetical protein